MLARRPSNVWALGPFGGWHNDIERFFDDCVARRQGDFNYDIDVREDEDHVYVEAELPGLTKDDIEISLEDSVLNISGEKKVEHEDQQDNVHLCERRYGKFSRSFRIPNTVDQSKIDATLADGVLRITLDKREEVKPRRIDVKVN